jgi:hypothetical protein
MSDIDPKLKKLLEDFNKKIGLLIDETATQGLDEELDFCALFDSMSHLLLQRAGQMEAGHLESDKDMVKPGEKITKEELAGAISTIHSNALKSLCIGMDTVLSSGGHYTIEKLTTEIVEKIKELRNDQDKSTSKPKKGSGNDGSNSGRTFH